MNLGDVIRIHITLHPRPVIVTATVTRVSGPSVYVTPHSGRWAGTELKIGRGCEVAREVVK